MYVEGENCYEADRNYMGETDPYAMNLKQAQNAERWLLKYLPLYEKYSGENFDYRGRLVHSPVIESDNGAIKFVYDDGGRSKYFRADKVGDCGVRAICNATGMDYKEVYDGINNLAKKERVGSRKKGVSSARNGVYKQTVDKFMKSIGWRWVPCMTIGSGCTVHLRSDELPKGNLVVSLSKHYSCVKDGVLHDTYDCSRGGTRCVYGYWTK